MSLNTEQLRQILRQQWLIYYRDNREWLSRLAVWVDCNGERRPSSGFILATLSVLEPRLTHLLPLIVDLSNNPDRIVLALGLNFNPDTELKSLDDNPALEGAFKFLPGSEQGVNFTQIEHSIRTPAELDETCRGTQPDLDDRR